MPKPTARAAGWRGSWGWVLVIGLTRVWFGAEYRGDERGSKGLRRGRARAMLATGMPGRTGEER
jgi:hypothetical protein